jgi:hypothetical protein
MAPPINSRSSRRATPAELAEHFKEAQQQMKADAASRRAAAESDPAPRRRRLSGQDSTGSAATDGESS